MDICCKLGSIGINFEYGHGFVGETLQSLIDNSETIIKESLGLSQCVPIEKMCCINGVDYPVSVDVLHTKEQDPEWSITYDDFYEFFYKAIENEEIREIFWNAFTNKDLSAKEKYNSLKIGYIGTTIQ